MELCWDCANGQTFETSLKRLHLVQEEIDHHYWDFKITGDLLELRNLAIVAFWSFNLR